MSNRRIILYKVVQEQSINLLEARVNQAITEGWEPLGGVFFIWPNASDINTYKQVVVTYSPEIG